MYNLKNEKFLKAFGQHLRDVRLSKGLSQEQLANQIDTTISQIGRIERGEINTTICTVLAISNALKLETKQLFDFEFNLDNHQK